MMKQTAIYVCAVAALGGMAGAAQASDSFPSKPIRILVGNPPGSIDDVWARRYAHQLTERFKHTVIVENKPGVSGTLAVMELLKAPKDGHTLLYGGMASLIQYPSAGGTVRYNPKTDVEPVAMATLGYPVLTAGANSWAKTIQDVIAKGKEGKPEDHAYSCGTSGQAATSHFVCELSSKALRMNFKSVPYKGGSLAATDAASGHVDFSAGFYGEIAPLTSGKRLTPLMVFSPKRFPLFPDTPTVGEMGFPELEMVSFSAFFVPKGAPASAVSTLNKMVVEAYQNSPQMHRWLSDAGAFYDPMKPEALKAFYLKEIDLWTQRSKDHNIRVEQ